MQTNLELDCYSSDEHGEAPGVATVTLCKNKLDRIVRLSHAARGVDAQYIVVFDYEVEWHEWEDLEDPDREYPYGKPVQMDIPMLYIGGDGDFWWEAAPHNSSTRWETSITNIHTLLKETNQ